MAFVLVLKIRPDANLWCKFARGFDAASHAFDYKRLQIFFSIEGQSTSKKKKKKKKNKPVTVDERNLVEWLPVTATFKEGAFLPQGCLKMEFLTKERIQGEYEKVKSTQKKKMASNTFVMQKRWCKYKSGS